MARVLRVLTTVSILIAQASPIALSYAQAQPNMAICAIYNTYVTVRTAIYILAIMLVLLGAATYAGSHMMPGQSRGNIQGYGMGMIMGGIIGVIIATIAPFVLQVIAGNQYGNAVGNVATLCA